MRIPILLPLRGYIEFVKFDVTIKKEDENSNSYIAFSSILLMQSANLHFSEEFLKFTSSL